MEEIQKKCTRCFKQKYLYEFYDKKTGKHNKASVCIQCNKEMRLLSKIAKGFLFEHTTKICTKCYHEKDLCEFHLNPLGKYGYKSVCMECTHAQRAGRFAREDFNDLKIIWAKEQYQKNKEAIIERTTAYRKARPEKYKFYWERWEQNNLEYRLKKKDLWKQANKSLITQYSANYRARKIKATPDWAMDANSKKAMARLYAEAERIELETGIRQAVDHIVPLNSKLVCGLHCPDNLRVISFSENSSKSNRYWPDMP